ncbi:MAG: cytochrome P460 family protein [Hyphomonadaceae bacterium]
MRKMQIVSGAITAIVTLGLVACTPADQHNGSADAQAPAAQQAAVSASGYDTIVSDTGAIAFPDDYNSWAHMGSWAVVNEGGEGNGIHNVFTSPEAIAAFKKTGEWPDGAVLVKEVFGSEGAQLTTGAANWATDPAVWFVMVKDTEGRFPDNPLWGNGWGWALFNAETPGVQVATDFNADCLGCHIPAEDTDWIYTYAYPTLKAR